TGLVMALVGGAGPLRFGELRERLDAVGDRMLSARLKELEARGLVERTVTPGPPVKVTYALSELGRGFGDVHRALGRWGEKLAAANHPKKPRGRTLRRLPTSARSIASRERAHGRGHASKAMEMRRWVDSKGIVR